MPPARIISLIHNIIHIQTDIAHMISGFSRKSCAIFSILCLSFACHAYNIGSFPHKAELRVRRSSGNAAR